MENRLQATFMPRQSPTGGGEAYARAKGQTNFLMIIGVALFILIAASWAGLYFYKDYIKSSNDTKRAEIEDEIQNFEPELTKELTTLKSKMDVGEKLLAGHHAFSLLFSLMELNTAQPVRFTNLAYTVSPDKKIFVEMEGEARSYNAIAFQSDVFSKLEPLKSPVFSGLSLTERGTITFDVTAELDANAVSYKKLIEGFAPLQASSTISSTATTTPVINGSFASSTGTTTPGRPNSTSTTPRR